MCPSALGYIHDKQKAIMPQYQNKLAVFTEHKVDPYDIIQKQK